MVSADRHNASISGDDRARMVTHDVDVVAVEVEHPSFVMIRRRCGGVEATVVVVE